MNNPDSGSDAGLSPVKISLRYSVWLLPALLLGCAYGLLALTLTEQLSHAEIMQRCVLVNPRLARIWSVGNVEIGLAYLGVFVGMLFYFLGIYRKSRVHLTDLSLAIAYLTGSFALDYLCVLNFQPFVAILIGDAVVMTFTVIVSRQIWFQRLLGVFVPIIFLTCGIGHFLEGASYWCLTYHINVPWTMVTADVGFAVLVNSSRFPAFIRGEDIVAELAQEKIQTDQLRIEIEARRRVEAENGRLLEEVQRTAAHQNVFMQEMLASVTDGKLRLCRMAEELPAPFSARCEDIELTSSHKLKALRQITQEAAEQLHFPDQRWQYLITAVSEAGMNAIVHAGGGLGRVCSNEKDIVQVWVEDSGLGIDLEHLPRATLQRGYTTAGTLGHGLKMMIQTADRIWLLTSRTGTTVVIEQSLLPPEPTWA